MLEQQRVDHRWSLEIDEVTRTRDDLESRASDARMKRLCNAMKIRSVAFSHGDQRRRGDFNQTAREVRDLRGWADAVRPMPTAVLGDPRLELRGDNWIFSSRREQRCIQPSDPRWLESTRFKGTLHGRAKLELRSVWRESFKATVQQRQRGNALWEAHGNLERDVPTEA